MIFMGEEYGEENPFYYFSDFSDPKLIQGVREGRKRDNGQETDPQSDSTFNSSKLSWKVNDDIFSFYKTLIKIRKEYGLACNRKLTVENGNHWLTVKGNGYLVVYVFSQSIIEMKYRGTLVLSSNNSFPSQIVENKYKLEKGFALYKL